MKWPAKVKETKSLSKQSRLYWGISVHINKSPPLCLSYTFSWLLYFSISMFGHLLKTSYPYGCRQEVKEEKKKAFHQSITRSQKRKRGNHGDHQGNPKQRRLTSSTLILGWWPRLIFTRTITICSIETDKMYQKCGVVWQSPLKRLW